MAIYTMTVVFSKHYLHSLNGRPQEACCSSWRIVSEEVAPNQYFVAVFLGTLDGSCSFGAALLPKDVKHSSIRYNPILNFPGLVNSCLESSVLILQIISYITAQEVL